VISRRHVLAGTGAALLLAACSDDSGSSADDDPTTTTASGGGSTTTTAAGQGDTDVVLGEAFDRNFLLVAGIPQRAPFVLFNREGGLVKYADAPATLDFVPRLDDGAPLAELGSTPAYCQVGICGPVLDLLVAEAPKHPGLTVIHIEVYPNGAPPDNEPTKVVTDTFGMGYEPALFVVGADGLLTARLDNIYDGAELAEVLSAV
jgi:hypothetical protein